MQASIYIQSMYTTGTNGLPSTSMLWLIQQHLKHHIQMAMLKHATLASIQTGLLNTNFRLRRHRLHTHNSALHNCSSTAIQSQLHSDAKWHQILGTRVVTITSSISQALSSKLKWSFQKISQQGKFIIHGIQNVPNTASKLFTSNHPSMLKWI